MNQSHDASDSRAPRQTSLLKSSAIMASGTLVSRILGFVRTALLIIAIGEGAGSVSATFQVANTLPNTVFNLLASTTFWRQVSSTLSSFRRSCAH